MKKIFCLLLIIIFLSGCTNESMEVKKESYLTLDEMVEDIKYLENTIINTHPKFHNKESIKKYQCFIDKLAGQINDNMTENQFYFIVSQGLAYIKDGHTSVDIYARTFKSINAKFIWIDENLYIKENTKELSKGDEILEICGKNPKRILDEMKKVISTENEYWFKFKTQQLLPTRVYLDYFNLLRNDTVNMKITKKNGVIKNVTLKVNKEIKLIDSYNFDNSYDINHDNNIGILKLNNLSYLEDNINLIYEFYQKVYKESINKIVIDIRNSSGGTSTIIDEILKYYPVNPIIHLNNHKIENENYDVVYQGNTYVAISKESFSSASALSGIFKYNDVGLVIGEPTGGSTICYGNTELFELPNSKIKYNVASQKFTIPVDGLYKNSIYPHVYIPYTFEDLINNNDPVIEWVLEQ